PASAVRGEEHRGCGDPLRPGGRRDGPRGGDSRRTGVAVSNTALLVCRGLSVTFGAGEARVDALRGVDLAVEPGDRLALWGRTGSGKTTLLHLLGGFVAPTTGEVERRAE